MKKTVSLILAILLLCSLFTINSMAVTIPEMVRVGIYFGSSALSSVTVTADGGVYLRCDGTDLGWLASATISQSGKNWNITGGAEPVTFYGEKMTVIPSGGLLTLKGKRYRGEFELVPNGSAITVVNHLNIEEYLYGVVPLEMSTGWPIEALKVQAVCARTFVARSKDKYKSQGFDVYNTTMSQVYGGYDVEKADTNRAVDETKGQVITYKGALIEALYSSASSNCRTFNVENVWGYPFDYLVSVDDSYQAIAKPDSHAWQATFTPAELQSIADKNGMQIGTVTDLKVSVYSDDGAVKELTFVGTNGTYSFKNIDTRNKLGVRSQSYEIIKNYESGTSVTVLGSAGKSVVSEPKSLGKNGELGVASVVLSATGKTAAGGGGKVLSYTLKGTGYGHGVGMSQYGAKGMAMSGFTYDQIIKHYYTGVDITQ